MRVRPAMESDVDWMMSELQDFASQYGTNKSLFPDTPEKAALILTELMEQPYSWIAETEGGEPAGLMVGMMVNHWMNPNVKVLTEVYWWVPVRFRGTSAGSRLLKEFTDAGKRDSDWVVLTLESNSPVNPDSLEKRGFREHERSYLYEVK